MPLGENLSFTLFLHSTDHLLFPQTSFPSSYFIIPSRSKKQKASGSWHPLLETAKKGKALAQRISNSLLQPVLPYITVMLHLEVGEQGETLPSPFDSQREREQKKREVGYEPNRLRDWLLVFPAVEWEQRVRRGDCYVKNRFDSHTLSPLFVPLLIHSRWGEEEGENYTCSSTIPSYSQTSYKIWISTSHGDRTGRLFWDL